VTAAKKAGDDVNVEIDMVGKYVEKSVQAYFSQNTSGDFTVLERMVGKLVDEKLRQAKAI
jgi:riboflavin synthase